MTVNLPFMNFTGFSESDIIGKNCNCLQDKQDDRNRNGNWKTNWHMTQEFTMPLFVTFFNATKRGENYLIYNKIQCIRRDGEIVGYFSLGKPMRELCTIYKVHCTKEELEEREYKWLNNKSFTLSNI